MNVAISRVRCLLVIVGDADTVVRGASEVFGPILAAAERLGGRVGPGVVVNACSKLRMGSATVRFSKSRSATSGRAGVNPGPGQRQRSIKTPRPANDAN